jgi:hypothetical protein
MGLGRAVKIFFTNQVKCDNCGRVIVDGTTYSKPKYKWDGSNNAAGQFQDGVGVLNTLVYSAKKRVLCDMCKALEKHGKQIDAAIAQENAANAEQRELEKENLRLENQLLKQKLNNESRNAPPPVNRAAVRFCSGCGNALKQGAQFCSKCGQRMG